MNINDRFKIIVVKLLDRWVNPDFRKKIILTLLSYSFLLISGTLLNININQLTIKNGEFSFDLIFSQTSNYVIFGFALMFLLAAIYQTSYLIKYETIIAFKKIQYDESLIDRLDNIVSMRSLIELFDHINSNLSVLEPDIDIIPDLSEEINRHDSIFQFPDIEYLRVRFKESLNDLNEYIFRQFHTYADDLSIMLMPDQRRQRILYDQWSQELHTKVNKAKSDYLTFRQYCTETLIK